MAIWQFKVALIPQEWVDSGGRIDSLFGEDGFDSASAWVSYNDARVEESLGAVLLRAKSWHNDLSFWGDVTTDDIQLFRAQGRIESLSVRFDLRKPNIRLFHEIVRVAHELQLVIVCLGERRLLPLDAQGLMSAAGESDAADFVMDPESFLRQVAATHVKAT